MCLRTVEQEFVIGAHLEPGNSFPGLPSNFSPLLTSLLHKGEELELRPSVFFLYFNPYTRC